MKLQLKSGKPEAEKNDLLVVGLYEGEKALPPEVKPVDAALDGIVQALTSAGDFKGKAGQTMLLPTGGKLAAKRVLLVGLGKKKDLDGEKLRQFWGKAASTTRDLGVRNFSGMLVPGSSVREAAQAAAEGIWLGLYTFDQYKTTDDEAKARGIDAVTLLVDKADTAEAKEGITTGEAIAQSVRFTRDLVTLPGGTLTPEVFADRAKAMAEEVGLTCQVLNEKEIARLKMGGLLGVAQGSEKPPRFIVLEHKGKGAKGAPLVFVGKGITFDSGGISIKPAEGMEKMKYDMAGGAAVVGAMRAIASLGLPIHAVGLVPTTENMPSGTAIHPGDVLTTMSGKTVEVVNTDAEGRLILSDALAYAARYKPAAVVDLATLTGACVIALGSHAIGMMGTDEKLLDKIRAAGEKTYERTWPLPLFEEYEEQIKSDIADVKNTGGRGAGTITAALFLKKFVDSYAWAHLDIAGTAWEEKGRPYVPKGATGVGVRLLTQLARDWSSK